MSKGLIVGLVLAFLAMLLGSCGQPAPPPPETPSYAHPAFIMVLCSEANKIDILNPEDGGKFVRSIALQEKYWKIKSRDLGVSAVLAGENSALLVKSGTSDEFEKIDLGFKPAEIGYASPKQILFMDAVNNKLVAYSVSEKKFMASVGVPAGPGASVTKVLEKNRFLYLACNGAKKLVEIDLKAQAIQRTMDLPDSVSMMILDPVDKKSIYLTLPNKGSVVRVDMETMAITGSVDIAPGIKNIAIPSTADKLYVSVPTPQGATSGSIAVIELPDFKRALPDPIIDTQLVNPGSMVIYDMDIEKPTLYCLLEGTDSIAMVSLRSLKVTNVIKVSAGPIDMCYIPPM